jgi:hypothetical protein
MLGRRAAEQRTTSRAARRARIERVCGDALGDVIGDVLARTARIRDAL